MDLRFGAFLGGSIRTQFREQGACDTSNTDYGVLPHLFQHVSVTENDVLVDVGCGKGRVINWWLSRGIRNQIIGVELDPIIADATRRRLRRFSNVSILAGSILNLLPSEGTLYYLFNPFEPWVVMAFRDTIIERAVNPVSVLFYNFTNEQIAPFREDDRWTVTRITVPPSPWTHGGAGVARYDPAGRRE